MAGPGHRIDLAAPVLLRSAGRSNQVDHPQRPPSANVVEYPSTIVGLIVLLAAFIAHQPSIGPCNLDFWRQRRIANLTAPPSPDRVPTPYARSLSDLWQRMGELVKK